jgi:hypothetical protein
MMSETLQSGDNTPLQTSSDGQSESIGKAQSCGFNVLELWGKAFIVVCKALQYYIAQGAFAFYFYFGLCHLLAPYFALISAIGLKDPYLIIGSILTLFIFYPYFELLIAAPIGIYAETRNFKSFWYLSPVHWAIKGLEYAITVMQDKTCLALFIVMIATLFVGTLIVIILILLSSVPLWSAYAILLLLAEPICFAVWTIARVIFHSWVYFIYPSKMIHFTKEEEESKNEWTLIWMWENYAKDMRAGPLVYRRASPDFFIHIIVTILLCALVLLNILIMIHNFSWIYCLSSIIIWLSFPFLIRFNLVKIFRKQNYTYHQKFLKCGRILLGIQATLFFLLLIFIGTAITSGSKENAGQDFISSGNIPVINQSFAAELPTICTTQFQNLSMLQFAGIAQTPEDSKFGDTFVANKLRLVLGRAWNETFEIIRTGTTDHAIFQHFRWRTNPFDLMVVTGKDTLSDNLLRLSIAQLYQLPEDIFLVIPFAKGIYDGMLRITVDVFSFLVDLYTPRRLISAYADPLHDYINDILASGRQVLLIGTGAGGGVAKSLGMHLLIKTIAYDSPVIRSWLLHNRTDVSFEVGFAHNIMIMDQEYAGSETGATAEYIPFDNFPMNPASQSAVICVMGIQCRLYDHFRDFCEKTLPDDILTKIQDNSPYH